MPPTRTKVPIDVSLIPDAWVRGKLDMFMSLVEIANTHPEWVDDEAIDALYAEVKEYCDLQTIMYVTIKKPNQENQNEPSTE